VLGVTTLSGAQRENYDVYGAGTRSCGEWTSRRGSVMRDVMLMWVLGFVSGAGFAGRELRRSDAKGIEAWLDRRCTADPLLPLSRATAELVDELSKPAQ
jgi:hypothetical protein